jgi:hypothetical protein
VYLSGDIPTPKGVRHQRWWHHVTPAQLRRTRTHLAAFAKDLFASVPRKDQRRWGQTYLRACCWTASARRSSRWPPGSPRAIRRPTPTLEQALQQFVNQSPWDPAAVRRRLAERMTAAIKPQAWVVDDTGFPNYGRHSVGVALEFPP